MKKSGKTERSNGSTSSRGYGDRTISLRSWSEALLETEYNESQDSPRGYSLYPTLDQFDSDNINYTDEDRINSAPELIYARSRNPNEYENFRNPSTGFNSGLQRPARFNPFDNNDDSEPETSNSRNVAVNKKNVILGKLKITEIVKSNAKGRDKQSKVHSPVHSQQGYGHQEVSMPDSTEKMKTKVLSAWNNVKYGWTLKMKTHFNKETPIFILGSCYHLRHEVEADLPPGQSYSSSSRHSRPNKFQLFQQDFTSRIWLTYRREFPQLQGSELTTDCGWGCMLRSGQMMLAQGFVMHFLGRDWRLFKLNMTREEDIYHRQIIRWFGDSPSNHSPFSVHRLVQLGEKSGKRAGDWYGPASVAHIMKEAMAKAVELQPILSQVCAYVARDCTIYKQDVIELCTRRPRAATTHSQSSLEDSGECDETTSSWRSVILLVPVRLGSETLNEIYIPCVKALLAHDTCIGIIGGRPKHSLYFVGSQDEKFVHLDPHFCQDTVDMTRRDFPTHTFHCVSPRKMSITKMDPSCTFGFYCKTQQDFENFCQSIKAFLIPPKQRSQYPMFMIENGKSPESSDDRFLASVETERYVQVRHLDDFGRSRSIHSESEDFVFL